MTQSNAYHHHHHVVRLARISLTLSRFFSLSFIASGRSSGLHPVPSNSCCMYVRAGRPAFARPYVGVHKEYITYELVPASPAVSCMSGSSNLDSSRDGRQVTAQLLPCGLLPPGLVKYCSQHSRVIAVQLFLQPFCQRSIGASMQQYKHDRTQTILMFNMFEFGNDTLAKWVECLPIARETVVQFQVESYKKWYLMPP